MLKKICVILCLSLVFACTNQTDELKSGELAIIPLPSIVEQGEGYFVFDKSTTIGVENEEQEAIAAMFVQDFENVSDWKPSIAVNSEGNIKFITDKNLQNEAYALDVSTESIVIKASSGAGFFYATQSLKQLFPASFFNNTKQPGVIWGIPVTKIEDQPAFGWRGYMLDVSRHFFDKEQVKEVLDFMAEQKLNRFHWHLADDQGWRLEIKSYPKLTEVGAWRMDYNVSDESISNWWGRPVQKPGEKPTYGGFYTQEEVKEIIAYAKERYIEIIPEIDMPGHAQATIAAYPEIGCVNAAPYVATGGVFKNNTYNPGKEETFEFAEKMLNEVMDLFPFNYVHIGGDECNKSHWLVDPYAQQRIKDEGLKDVYELQSYFIKRIEKMINKRGRIMIGWDEILEGGLAPNATVMSWRGEAGGIKSAKAGHDVIMTPNKYCYIDLKQGHDDLEPNLGYSELLLSKSYSYKVIPDDLTADEGKHILGIQANLWTESISDWGKLTYMSFPRLFAISESGWTAHKNKNWDDFTARLKSRMKRMDAEGIRYATSAFSPWIDHEGKEDLIEISMKTEVNGLDIYYTLDGTDPSKESLKYEGPFTIDKTTTLNARAFDKALAVGYQSTLPFVVHKGAGARVTAQKGTKKELPELADLNYGKLNRGDKRWQNMGNNNTLEIDFGATKSVQSLSFNTLRFAIAAIYPPKQVHVYGSLDGKEFEKLGSVDNTEQALIQGRNKIPIQVNFEERALKKLRVVFENLSPLPEGHHRAGQNSSVLVDELVVN